MKYSVSSVGTTPEILKRKLGAEFSKPITLASSAFTNGVCKAGTPINADGEKAQTSAGSNDAIGILWNDVEEGNPNASLIVAYAVINSTVAAAYSGVTYDATLKSTLSNLIFE